MNMNYKKIFNEWKWVVICLLLIVAIGFIVRVYNLTILPVFADEAIYIRWAQVMRAEATLRFLPLSDGKQPLFMWIMIPFLKLISDPLFAGRITSVFSGVGTIIGIFVASYLLFKSKKISLIAALIYSIVPYAVFFDRMALADSMLTMFGVWTFTLGILLVQNLRLDIAMILGFVLGGALLTKSPALYFSLLLPTLVIFVKNRKSILQYVILLIPTYLIAYGMYNILRLGPNFGQLAARNLDYVYPISHILSSPFDPFKPFLDRSKEFYWIMGGSVLFVTWILGYLLNWKSKFKELVVLTFWFLGPILVSSEFSKTMTARYVFFSIPYFVIIASTVFLVNFKRSKMLVYGFLLLFIFQSLVYDFRLLKNVSSANLPRSERSGYLEEWTAGQGIKEISDFLKELPKNEKVLVGTEGFFGTLPDGLQIYFNGLTNVNVIGVGLQLEEIPKSLVDSKRFGNRTFLVVNNERLHFKPDSNTLNLVAEYPKATRPDGTIQKLLFFELIGDGDNKYTEKK
jgi:4-amino-4-deoxy-L-arabinose transferase-like glycosyltransferase